MKIRSKIARRSLTARRRARTMSDEFAKHLAPQLKSPSGVCEFDAPLALYVEPELLPQACFRQLVLESRLLAV